MDKFKKKIGLGTVQFGTHYGISNKKGQTNREEVAAILEIAQNNNIKIIDTASAYGTAEKILGENDLSSFNIVSKFMPTTDDAGIAEQLGKSLSDLSVPSLYGYLAHRPEHLVENPGQWKELQVFKEQGKVRKTGFSLNSPLELEKLLDGNMVPDLVQVPYNYFDRRFTELVLSLKKRGCEIHARSAFLQGLFFMDIKELDSYFDDIKPLIKQLRGSVGNLSGALLNFVVRQPFIDYVIIGVENKGQFIRNLQSLGESETLPDLSQEISESILMPSNWPN